MAKYFPPGRIQGLPAFRPALVGRGIWSLRGLLTISGLLCVTLPLSAGPVLHEKFEPDPAEDLRYGATTPSGAMPAALQTRSGVVSAPPESAGPSHAVRQNQTHTYGGASTPDSVDATYQVDRLTTRPDRVRYDEPFRPSILPFKRLYAFDLLEDDLSFSVQDKSLEPISVGGRAEDSEDAFFGDFEVDLVDDVPVRIPSVGPGAHVRALHVDPPSPVVLLRDSADNWFAKGARTGRARIVMQVTIDRRVFGSAFATVGFEELAQYKSPFPGQARGAAQRIARHVGALDAASPADALSTLVDYFRRFEASSTLPSATDTENLYVELSLDQKGVCRHRAYAFAVTALFVGIPTRVVHNEAHAWVEVFDGEIWHRVDLGGAAAQVEETRPDPTTPGHRPPNDPYSWPRKSQPGLGLAPANASVPHDDKSAASGASGDGQSTSWPSATQSTVQSRADSATAPSHVNIELVVQNSDLSRGKPLRVIGRATRHGKACSLSRVDFFLEGAHGPLPIGSLSTDRAGEFAGTVTIPRDAAVGNQTLKARLGAGCN